MAIANAVSDNVDRQLHVCIPARNRPVISASVWFELDYPSQVSSEAFMCGHMR